MTISVDWAGTSAIPYQIYVEKTDMTLVQASPVEIYELDLDVFRLTLRDLEDDPDGRPWPKTHSHNTEVPLGGVTYARIIQILAPYSVTFEDGQYAVNLIGANSNVGDVVNVNQVSVRSNNSAGLISTPLIEYDVFQGGVWVDITSQWQGTIGLVGTPLRPVNNIDDALLIADYRGFHKIYFIGGYQFGSGHDLRNKIIIGETTVKSEIEVLPAAQVQGAEFLHCYVHGTLDGECTITHCIVGDLDYVEGYIENCMIIGTVAVSGVNPTQLIKCYDGLPGAGLPIIDCGGSGRSVGIWGWHGGLKLVNKTGSENVSVNMDTGRLIIDSTVTSGTVLVKGVGLCQDNSTGDAVVDTTGLVNADIINEKLVNEHGSGDWSTELLRKFQTNRLELTDGNPGIWTLYDDDNVTPLKMFEVRDVSGGAIIQPAGAPSRRAKAV